VSEIAEVDGHEVGYGHINDGLADVAFSCKSGVGDER